MSYANAASSSSSRKEEGAFGTKRKHNEDLADGDSFTKALFPTMTSTFKFKQIPELESTLMSDEQVNKCNDIETLKAQLKSHIFKVGMAEAQLEDFKMGRNTEREAFHKKENEAESSNAAFKEETYQKILELMKSELSCSVCNEIFIQATVIECGHTFCGFCIAEWSRTKQECPICRKRFTRRCRHIEMDNFITKMFESFDEEITSNRQATILDRENQVKRAEEEAAARAQTARQNRSALMGGYFPVLIPPLAERDLDFLLGFPPINEPIILNPRPNNVSLNDIESYSSSSSSSLFSFSSFSFSSSSPSSPPSPGAAGGHIRRSARIQERVVGDGVDPAVEQGTSGRRRGS